MSTPINNAILALTPSKKSTAKAKRTMKPVYHVLARWTGQGWHQATNDHGTARAAGRAERKRLKTMNEVNAIAESNAGRTTIYYVNPMTCIVAVEPTTGMYRELTKDEHYEARYADRRASYAKKRLPSNVCEDIADLPEHLAPMLMEAAARSRELFKRTPKLAHVYITAPGTPTSYPIAMTEAQPIIEAMQSA